MILSERKRETETVA